jgi:2-polyprenyl-6-methoxyphenol hydroxylase-like FAD-dependent oxidoreductase
VANIGKGNLWRVAFGVPTSELNAEEPYDQARELTRARVALNKLLPGPTDEAVIENISLYRLRQLCADTYVKNRVALAGDAAHVSTIPSEFNNLIAFVRKTNLLTSLLLQMTSPIGGLGLTTGLLDAALLARNLKKIILDSEPLSLLEIYGETRRDVYLNAAKPAAIFHTRLLTGTSEADVARRQEFIEAVNKRDFGYLKKNVGEAYGKLSSTRDEQ